MASPAPILSFSACSTCGASAERGGRYRVDFVLQARPFASYVVEVQRLDAQSGVNVYVPYRTYNRSRTADLDFDDYYDRGAYRARARAFTADGFQSGFSEWVHTSF